MMKRKHTVTDALFRYFYIISDNIDEEFKEDINDFLKVKLKMMKVALI